MATVFAAFGLNWRPPFTRMTYFSPRPGARSAGERSRGIMLGREFRNAEAGRHTRRAAVRLSLAFVAAVGALAAGSPRAHAQSLRPNILFIFDTSGSMDLDNNAGAP